MINKLTPMTYKSFKFPNNPADCKYSSDRSYVKHKYVQSKNSDIEDFGPNAVIISGTGEFFGKDAYKNWRKLVKEYNKMDVGSFSHPIYTDVTRALMTKCESQLEPREDYIKYTFEFIADTPPKIVKSKKTSATPKGVSASASGTSTSQGFKVGDVVYVTGNLYYDSNGRLPKSAYFNNKKMTITKIVDNPKSGQDWTIHCGTVGWGKPGQMKRSAKSTTTDSKEIIATHVVKPGDSLSKICAKYNTDWKTVAEYNKIKDPNKIRPGYKIKIVK